MEMEVRVAPRDILGMVKEAFKDWNEDNAPRLGAALSYYTIFSIAPLLLISIAVAGLVFGAEAAQGGIVTQIQGLVGRDAAEAIQGMLENARKPGQGILATIFGAVTLIFGAGGAFNELRAALDVIWEIPPRKGGGVLGMIRERLLSFAMVLVVGFLLLVSLVLSAGISALEVKGTFPGSGVVLQVVNNAVSLAVITVLFALIFKYLPDAHPPVAWKDLWTGAFITAALFTLGKYAIGLYLGRSSVASAYGAAGSLVLLLVWVYYSAQILFFGAEVTQVLARRHGSRLGLPADTEAAEAPTSAAPSPKDAGRVVRPKSPAPVEPPAPEGVEPAAPRPPASEVGRGLAMSAVLLLLGFVRKKKRRWPF
jgi:membrane protein